LRCELKGSHGYAGGVREYTSGRVRVVDGFVCRYKYKYMSRSGSGFREKVSCRGAPKHGTELQLDPSSDSTFPDLISIPLSSSFT
jgi:hypothetical protein